MTNQQEQVNMDWVVTVLLWFFLGGFGAHRFYNNKTGSGVAMLLLSILGFILAIVIVGFILLAIVGIWWFIDGIIILMGKFENSKGEAIGFRISESNDPESIKDKIKSEIKEDMMREQIKKEIQEEMKK